MDKLFRTARAIAKKGRPFTDFAWMCELNEMKGLEITVIILRRAASLALLLRLNDKNSRMSSRKHCSSLFYLKVPRTSGGSRNK